MRAMEPRFELDPGRLSVTRPTSHVGGFIRASVAISVLSLIIGVANACGPADCTHPDGARYELEVLGHMPPTAGVPEMPCLDDLEIGHAFRVTTDDKPITGEAHGCDRFLHLEDSPEAFADFELAPSSSLMGPSTGTGPLRMSKGEQQRICRLYGGIR